MREYGMPHHVVIKNQAIKLVSAFIIVVVAAAFAEVVMFFFRFFFSFPLFRCSYCVHVPCAFVGTHSVAFSMIIEVEPVCVRI